MKKILSLLLAVLTLLSFAACGETALNGTIDELFAEIEPLLEGEEVYHRTDDYLESEFNIQSDDYEEGYYKCPIDATIETVAFFKASSSENAKKIYNEFNYYIEDGRNRQEDYDAKSYDMVMNAVIEKKGLYVYMVISANKNEILSVIKDKLK